MTVAELIAELQKLPGHMSVVVERAWEASVGEYYSEPKVVVGRFADAHLETRATGDESHIWECVVIS